MVARVKIRFERERWASAAPSAGRYDCRSAPASTYFVIIRASSPIINALRNRKLTSAFDTHFLTALAW